MKILDRLPYSATPTTVPVHQEAVHVKPYQIVVQVSVSVGSVLGWDRRTPSFPAILDTGNNHNFAIRKSQLSQWAGLESQALQRIGTIREKQQRLPLHAANLWLHQNVPGQAAPSRQEPFPLNVDDGIAIFPDEAAPRLPVLGLRALTQNALRLIIDGEQLRVSISTLDWWTRILRWLS